MDMRNEITGCDEYEDADKEGGDVEQYEQRDIDLHRSLTDIVGLWIELYQTRIFLQEDDAETEQIA